MRYVVYLITLLLFSFSVQSNQSLEQSRANLSRINSDESDSGIACASAVLAWRVLCCKFNYTLMERSDKQKSFRFFTPNTLIWQEQELYLLKTQKTPVSYCQILMQDCDELLGLTQREKEDGLWAIDINILQDLLKKENQKILSYKEKAIQKYKSKTIEEMVSAAAELYEIRIDSQLRPNPFLAELYAQEIRKRLSPQSINPFSFKTKIEE